MALSSVSSVRSQRESSVANVTKDLTTDTFLKLLITELQSQDPLEPMSNQEIVQQLGQIREIESNLKLTDTLEAVRLGQGLAAASGMLGRIVVALSQGGDRVVGRVSQISIVEGEPRLNVDDQMVALKNVTEILDESALEQAE